MELTQVCVSPSQVISQLILLTLPSLNFSGEFKINSPLILFLIPPNCNLVIAVYTCAE